MQLGATASIAGLIIFGTITSLFAKLVYELPSVGREGQQKLFEKPWAMTTVMFLGMSLMLPIAWLKERLRRAQRAKAQGASEPLLNGVKDPAPITRRETLLLSLPSFFDLVATILMNIGLLSVTASVYQMMRGAEMLFAALFAIVFLKRHLNKFHYMGIACCVSGISLVGLSSILSSGTPGTTIRHISPEAMLLGMGLIILSQAVQAAQLTFEDFFMADLAIDPVRIVGYEGLYGAVFMVGLLLPVAYFLPGPEGRGLHEDTLDTLAMLRHSPTLLTIILVDMGALLAYNVSGMMVTGHLGAVFRTVLETLRTLFVWMVDLALFYTNGFGLGPVGEAWTEHSWIQAVGFVILVIGTLVYRKGDEEGAREELQAALEEQPPTPPYMTAPDSEPQLSGPVLIKRTATPTAIPFPSSLKSTMNISTSYVGSYAGSMGRSFPRTPGGRSISRASILQPNDEP